MAEPVVFHGGPIHPFATAASVPALLVDGGRVTAVGTVDDCTRAATGTPRLHDLTGRTLLPGFVDAHVHPLLLGDALASVDLSGARSFDHIVTALRAHAGANPALPAVTGYGYDQSKLAEQRHPSRALLDAVGTERQVRIQHASGHGYVVDSSTLRACGIDASTPTPAGGRIDRDADGEPTGLVFDAACDLLTGPEGVKIANHGPNFHLPLDAAQRARLFDLGQRALLAAGITTICDAQATDRETRAYVEARASGTLALRTHLLTLSSRLDELEERYRSGRTAAADDWLPPLGVKLYADGSVIARTAYLGEVCCGQPEPTGYLYHDPDELIGLIERAHRLGLPTATHAQGELPIDIVLDAVARCRQADPRPDLVHRIEHCGFPTDRQIARMAELGVVPVPQPMQVTLYGDSLMAEYGDYGGRFYPTGDFVRAGLPVVVSSDGPVTDPDPLRAAASAVTRATLGEQVAGGADGERARQGVDVATALAGITTTPARLLGGDHSGTLTIGSNADLVVLDTDPTTGRVDDLNAAAVTETWVGGDLVFHTD